ncbi:hypothetical protein SARC_05750 [Sphaeroforma arctica JP610]|uniref:Uncharacterized protein n=1 Tax=Sphaeroforma arctica JP610 TaxID=667725 RepID=A0A0L0FZA0_9EUKA|nr:hypothetical protein SARC_05750 [Sphaeroforma arctica JP610]KNC81959.1 hypothetical protein SARC_05750 [Sphaeroforma arctica JP610]|eukprot:XP_014155861.1 hypothetical protein SARC_05750 [Sphaeroforma arctica JP610]
MISWSFKGGRVNTITRGMVRDGINFSKRGKHVFNISRLVECNRGRRLTNTETYKVANQTQILARVVKTEGTVKPELKSRHASYGRYNFINIDEK